MIIMKHAHIHTEVNHNKKLIVIIAQLLIVSCNYLFFDFKKLKYSYHGPHKHVYFKIYDTEFKRES